MALLLTACDSVYLPAPMTNPVVNKLTVKVGITERTVFELLIAALEQRLNSDLDCLKFRSESNVDNTKASNWEFAAMEIHDEICVGDPNIGHVRNRYKVNDNGSIMIYSVKDDKYQPL